MKLFSLYCTLLLVFCQTGYAQRSSEAVDPVFTYGEGRYSEEEALSRFFAARFQEYHKLYPQLCISSVTFAKFTLNEKGQVADIAFSEGSPQEVNSLIDKVIRTTNGYWKPAMAGGKAVKSKPLLLPVTYFLEANCDAGSRASQNQFRQIVPKLLQFDDGSYSGKQDAIILPPVELSSMR